MPPDQGEQQGIHGQIAFARDLEEDVAIGVLIFVKGVRADVEKGVMAQTIGLMHLKVEADGGHDQFLPVTRLS